MDEKTTNLSTNNLANKAIEDEKQSRIHGSTGTRPGLERTEFSSTFGLTEEETREFWDMILVLQIWKEEMLLEYVTMKLNVC